MRLEQSNIIQNPKLAICSVKSTTQAGPEKLIHNAVSTIIAVYIKHESSIHGKAQAPPTNSRSYEIKEQRTLPLTMMPKKAEFLWYQNRQDLKENRKHP